MRPIDNMPTKARRVVAERFRVYIQMLMSEFNTTPAELLSRAEHSSRMDNPPDREARRPWDNICGSLFFRSSHAAPSFPARKQERGLGATAMCDALLRAPFSRW